MPEPTHPAAFLSYAHVDDRFGGVTAFRERLAAEIEMQTGERFTIFQDRDLLWGEQWQQRINESLEAATFLIPIISPSFFNSEACREEVATFGKRERELGRSDLILPVYYIQSPQMHDTALQNADPIAALLASRQYVDWRPLRLEAATDPQIWKAYARLAEQVHVSLGRVATVRNVDAASPQRAPAAGARVAAPVPPRIAEPPLHVVDPKDAAAFRRIGDAVRAAAPGDRIVVRPGTYREGLSIDKAVQILGQGERAEIIIETGGRDVLSISAELGRVSNLTIRQLGGPGTWYAIDILQGRFEIDGCDITSSSLACIAIRGRARPHIHGNQIHDGRDAGALYADGGGGVFEENEVYANGRCGIDISDGADPTIRRNRIHDHKAGGIYVQYGGSATIEANEIFANENAAVEVFSDSTAVIRGNRMHRSKGGVYIEKATAVVDNNEIIGNIKFSAVEINSSTTDVVVRNNRLTGGAEGGIFVLNGGKALIEENEIAENTLTGIEVKTKSSVTIRRNVIRENIRDGVFVHTDGSAVIEHNEITRNGGEGIFVPARGSIIARHNQITENARHGLAIENSGIATLANNTFTRNRLGDTRIVEGAQVTNEEA